jgi:hypothetical protein
MHRSQEYQPHLSGTVANVGDDRTAIYACVKYASSTKTSAANFPMNMSKVSRNLKLKHGSIPVLSKGQTWRIEQGYLQVVDCGKTLVHYKIMRNVQHRVAKTQVGSKTEVADYLKANQATLIGPG